jgi:xylose dehydrogenase (NAD/NADP)
MTQPLRFGILGTGNIANQFAEGLKASGRCTLVAVASRSESSAAAFAQKHGGASIHGGYESLLDDPNVDAIYNSLPNTLHHPWTLRALQAGKHVLCEKPLAVGVAEAEEMHDVADKAGRVLIEGFMYRTHPMMREVVSHVRDGAIGKLKLVRASFCYATKAIDTNIRFDPALCGGSLMDIGCYCVDFGRLLTGDHPSAIEVSAHLHGTGVDDYAAGTLTYPSGAVLSFCCGQTVQMNNTAFIGGDGGYVEVPVPWKPPVMGATYVLKGQTPPRQDQRAGVAGGAAPPPDEHRVDAGKPLFGMEADAFAETVQDGAAPFVTRRDSLSNATVLEALRRQAGLAY